MSEPIKRIQSPVHLEYTVSAGRAHSRFLAALTEARLIGGRCSSCRKVYIPLRSVCPTCATPMSEEVTVADSGTVTTFCIVNVPFEGQTMKLPYVYASVLLDGADLPILHLIQIPAEEARMGVSLSYGEGVHLFAAGYAALGACLAPYVQTFTWAERR